LHYLSGRKGSEELSDRKAKAKTHAGKKMTLMLGEKAPSRLVGSDFDDDVVWFSGSDEESVEVMNADEKLKARLRTRVIALKKAKKVENVKVVSRTEKGKLVGLWLAKK
jgi:hypothetical protein